MIKAFFGIIIFTLWIFLEWLIIDSVAGKPKPFKERGIIGKIFTIIAWIIVLVFLGFILYIKLT
jgi:hypothetical protein